MKRLYEFWRKMAGGHSHESDMHLMLCEAIEEYLNQPVEIGVLRSEAAKKYPLLHTKKYGDVGFDLVALIDEPMIIKPIHQNYQLRWTNDADSAIGNPETMVIASEVYESDYPHDVLNRCTIPTGIRLELPPGYWASVEARSSTSKCGLICPKGVIDEGYRGEMFVVLMNISDREIIVNPGDRFAQLIIHKRHPIKMIEKESLSASERGENGFGHTGRSDIILER